MEFELFDMYGRKEKKLAVDQRTLDISSDLEIWDHRLKEIEMMLRNLVTKRASQILSKQSLATRYISSSSILLAKYDKSSLYRKPTDRVKKVKTPEEAAKLQIEEDLKSDSWIVRWGAKTRTKEFQKNMTWYYVVCYILFLVFGYKYMSGVFSKEKQVEEIGKKQLENIASEYDLLKLKELTGKLRRRDELKLEEYEKLKNQGIEDLSDVKVDIESTNTSNKNILPARDTTSFYDGKAEDYDSDINWEEKAVFMGRRRKWLMKHCNGDVLEVACGTGRNVKYLDMTQIKSITFLDSSSKMMEIANKKFREEFPTYKNAAFVVGRAEDLVDLASNKSNKDELLVKDIDDQKINVTDASTTIKYDTIVEAFGICSHEDPVKALKNFETLLKPGGRIVLLEHGRGEYDFINNILDNRAERRLESWGCRWNLDIGEILDDSGLEIAEEKRTHLGTTWCIVAKRKDDAKKKEEIGFVEKYISKGFQDRLKSMTGNGPTNDEQKK
ncbi:Methyltransferase OMS1, mitochondrial [Wickerhamomyces ciferrii]|uniref:Methyltransferase OMS1, mitochondrial n=1 Tax=Wickerhamomyces ciferrii (strain ATCC 14091 / BCRC 22168 / CBS 111 / JCM 3599 / NBRC 0793 / NRRL Y-1031 F-60-10) TaxID=1206466 RepID=K0KUW8_WICCF|nr:Methyltransferase OMS1, mitochondrial [Wickerhamomyces ciferrii]CCH45224.1 Methyltransferase OMS1, mitochondrial [Wickerhamomyces ciferrii]